MNLILDDIEEGPIEACLEERIPAAGVPLGAIQNLSSVIERLTWIRSSPQPIPAG